MFPPASARAVAGPPRFPPPRLVMALYAIDVLIALAFVAHLVFGPVHIFFYANQLRPGAEANIPTWYSSLQWALAGALLALYAAHAPRHLKGGIRLFLPAAAAFALSIDESVAIHERFGQLSDRLLPDNTREGTFFSSTGIWMLILVPIAVAGVVWIGLLLVDHLRAAPWAARLLIGGVAIFIVGAGVLETATNLATGNRPAQVGVQILEELVEMLGTTTVVWGSIELLRAGGVRIVRGSASREPAEAFSEAGSGTRQ
jgi:hypothetical protein